MTKPIILHSIIKTLIIQTQTLRGGKIKKSNQHLNGIKFKNDAIKPGQIFMVWLPFTATFKNQNGGKTKILKGWINAYGVEKNKIQLENATPLTLEKLWSRFPHLKLRIPKINEEREKPPKEKNTFQKIIGLFSRTKRTIQT